MAFIGGILGVVGALAMIWTYRHDGPVWLTLCGYAFAAGGMASVLIAVLPWLWRVSV